jgi:general secretion pathway protein M
MSSGGRRPAAIGSTASASAFLAALRALLGQRWQALAARERRGVALAGTALFLLLLWVLAIRPAWQVLGTAPAQRAALEGQLAQMRGLASEARELRAQPPVAPDQAEAALTSATTRLGAGAKLAITGDRATVTFTAVDPVLFTEWLGEVRSAARARVIEAQLNRSGQAYSGSVVLSLPRTP